MIYAKSDPIETLREHTDALIEAQKLLKESYGNNINKLNFINEEEFWNLLDIIVEFHDIGKAFSPFQKLIRDNMEVEFNEDKVVTHLENNVNHNYISPAFIKYKDLGIKDKELRKVLNQAIVYHHERDIFIDEDFKSLVQKVLDEDLINKVEEIQSDFKIRYPIKTKKLSSSYLDGVEKRITNKHEYYKLYIMLKGLLHKLDHSASAHELIEVDYDKYIGKYTEEFILNEYDGLRDVQKFAKENIDKNVLLIASTGMGKTETALIWINEDKAFFTLPLRVSINALFDRVKNIKDKEENEYKYAGLLHSTSIDYLEENDYEDSKQITDLSKLMSKKLTFSTIDQVFKFPFMYKGYEKTYATLAYSKVVIDEIQAYSPEIAAVLIKGLEMIHKIGGKFMIMTATMPTIYIDEMKERGLFDDNLAIATFNTEKVRHNIVVKDESINENIKEITKAGLSKKVLIIVNTVKSAIEKYEQIEKIIEDNELDIDLNLLHSMYIQEDRSKLEKAIKDFASSEKNGIWITTQLVEASLDIDFDILHTEISTLDSLFQRFGRCNRAGKKSINRPNIFIYSKEAQGIGTIYDEEIVKKGIELLKEYTKGKESLKIKEDDKVKMVEVLYSKENLENTEFYKKFKAALDILDTMPPYSVGSKDAQKILRDIDAYTVIPRQIYDKIEDNLIDEYKYLGEELSAAYNNKDKKLISELKDKRRSIRQQITKKTVSVSAYKVRQNKLINNIDVKGLEDLKILEYEYDMNYEILKGKGVLLGKELSQFI
ncbi:CRISPR-associated helicase/endonuclease Cas3 [Paraclostridium sordellii]|uniref:CRISPR-associated helicase/endonuclease Cas3 n=1 Tax=Paraclostridium sordellii TaxID=1505 RepID=UPI0005E96105|nr:CRISPR-associated helicase/endonuclease Cas3 [Paeniclostridium sordellii]CEP41821.1 CRISPR-associated Cas3 family helicase [[Clostridium] sordellii] [Paeniclostridium sordellii]